MMEKTLLLIKPDGVKRKLIGEIISRVEKNGFNILDIKFLKLTERKAKRLYRIHRGKDFYEQLCRFMTSGPIVAILLERENARMRLRELVGATDPKKAKKDTIRADFGTSIQENVVHAPNPEENPDEEIKLFFKEAIGK